MQQAPAHVSGPNAAKRLDICVWGSTGVVGRLVAEHLARDYQVGAFSLTQAQCACGQHSGRQAQAHHSMICF
jgi:short subunit dehydrogenase-like uncharacterized protein